MFPDFLFRLPSAVFVIFFAACAVFFFALFTILFSLIFVAACAAFCFALLVIMLRDSIVEDALEASLRKV
jgi:hypothetical protein